MIEMLTSSFSLETRGNNHIIDITPHLREELQESGFLEGQSTVFIPGSTAGITTIEYEPGLLQDIPEIMEEIIPSTRSYHHDLTWHDGNGYAHLRAALIKPSLTLLFQNRQFLLGTWQQVILIDFDNRPRHRHLWLQFMGTKIAS